MGQLWHVCCVLSVKGIGILQPNLQKVKQDFLGPPFRLPEEGIVLHKLVKPIHSLHVLGVLPDGHRAIKSDTLDCTTPLPTHPFPVRVHLRLDTMEGGDEGHQPCVKPAHNKDVIVSKVVVGVPRESPSCQALEERGGHLSGDEEYQCNGPYHHKGHVQGSLNYNSCPCTHGTLAQTTLTINHTQFPSMFGLRPYTQKNCTHSPT